MSDDNRARILDLAVAAIDAGGEAAIRVNHIVAEVGCTPPVLYYHFGSRDGLVIAAQVERYARRSRIDLVAIERTVSVCETREELRETMLATWRGVIAERRSSRWVRISAMGSAYARPELAAAIAEAQDELIVEMVRIFEPFRERGWFRPDIDLTTAFAWQHSVLIGRTSAEQGEKAVDLDEWDRLTLEAFERAFFGS